MSIHQEKSQPSFVPDLKEPSGAIEGSPFDDRRNESSMIESLQKMANHSPQVKNTAQLQEMANQRWSQQIPVQKKDSPANEGQIVPAFQTLDHNSSADSVVVQRHLFLDVPEKLHHTKDFGNWYTMACEYKQQKELAKIAPSVPKPLPSVPLGDKSETTSDSVSPTKSDVEDESPKIAAKPKVPLVNPSEFISSIRAIGSIAKIDKKGGVKMQIHGMSDLSASDVKKWEGRGWNLKDAELEKDGSMVKGKNVAIDRSIVSAKNIAATIMNKYKLTWKEFYPLYCFTADAEGQWQNTKRGGLKSGPLLNTPTKVVTFDGSTDMGGWPSFGKTKKRFISDQGSWNEISMAPLPKLEAYIANSKINKATEQDFRDALDQVYENVAPEYDAFRRYIETKGGITGETPNPWGL